MPLTPEATDTFVAQLRELEVGLKQLSKGRQARAAAIANELVALIQADLKEALETQRVAAKVAPAPLGGAPFSRLRY